MAYKNVGGGVLTYNNKSRKKALEIKKNNVPQWSGLTDYTRFVVEDLKKDIVKITKNNILKSKNAPIFFNDTNAEVGVVRDIDVHSAMMGVITTNPDNVSLDSPLGEIGNKVYACLLYNNAIKNDERKRESYNSSKGYITPSLSKHYGNTTSTLYTLSELLNVPEDGERIVKELAPDANIVRNGLDTNNLDSYDNSRVYMLVDMINNVKKYYEVMDASMTEQAIAFNGKVSENRYYPFINTDEKYINTSISKDGYSTDLLNARFDGFKEDGTVREHVTRVINHADKAISDRVNLTWGEKVLAGEGNFVPTTEDNISDFGYFENNISSKNNLLGKTEKLFNQHKIGTMVARFHSSNDNNFNMQEDSFDSAKDTVSGYGNSHGRSLFKLGGKMVAGNYTNGYTDPYCRAWTYHYQYSRMRHGIRNFFGAEKDNFGENDINIRYRSRFPSTKYNDNGELEKIPENERTNDRGGVYLQKNTVLQKNGLVKITPTVSDFSDKLGYNDGRALYDEISADGTVSKRSANIKRYMFSIENLAWADSYSSMNVRNLSYEQRGPNNGRIMWFPPYNLNFKESVKANWQGNSFIGRGEKVYTYSDTERHGTLSFTLLIDHPSILNSLTNYGGAAPDNDPEGDVLRFFAGCQILDPDAKYRSPEYDPKPDPPAPKEEEPEERVKELLEPQQFQSEMPEIDTGDTISFAVFYPNNYSGNFNLPDKNEVKKGRTTYSDVDKLHDLQDKEFAKLEADPRTKDYGCYDGEEWYKYILFGENFNKTSGGRGYETYITESDIKLKTYAGRNITNESIFVGVSNLKADNTAMRANSGPRDADYRKETCTKSPNNTFYYRTDGDLLQGGIQSGSNNSCNVTANGKRTNTNYMDLTNFRLNYKLDKQKPDIKGDYTFAEVMTVITGVYNDTTGEFTNNDIGNQLTNRYGSDENFTKQVQKLRDTLKYRKVTKISVEGGASSNNSKNAKTLSKRRTRTALVTTQTLLNKLLNEKIKIEPKSKVIEGTEGVGTNTSEGKNAKFAKVTIHLEPYDNKMMGENFDQQTSGVSEQINENTGGLSNLEEIPESAVYNKDEYLEIPKGTDINGEKIYNINHFKIDGKYYLRTNIPRPHAPSENTNRENGNKEPQSVVYDKLIYNSDDNMADLYSSRSRYDDEFRFFRNLKEDDPFAFKSIINKVKYFNPAYHSLSPEGFNSRLTFLHQCTRQGHTASASENVSMGATAGNLAFGKMPVCVLRIGDFINSRVIIESMSIDYQNGDSIQWDLNPEGAGVQPMFANVSMNITLLGGQSLSAPISRLQNAVSFDYYANAGVYDDRADRANYEGNGKVEYTHLFTPLPKR